MQYKSWEIWWARFAYNDKANVYKPRPVLIVPFSDGTYLMAKITTHKPRCNWDHPIKQLVYSGLNKESTICAGQLIKFTSIDLTKKIGDLHPIDIIEFQKKMKDYLKSV